jgi:hypothetical protein
MGSPPCVSEVAASTTFSALSTRKRVMIYAVPFEVFILALRCRDSISHFTQRAVPLQRLAGPADTHVLYTIYNLAPPPSP